jgi:hypothetical protein
MAYAKIITYSSNPHWGNEKDPANAGSFSMCSVVKDVRTELVKSGVLPYIPVHYISGR